MVNVCLIKLIADFSIAANKSANMYYYHPRTGRFEQVKCCAFLVHCSRARFEIVLEKGMFMRAFYGKCVLEAFVLKLLFNECVFSRVDSDLE